MPDLRRYWQEVRELESTLPEFLSVVSADGCVVEVSGKVAATLLHARSHRRATEEEIRVSRNRQKSATRDEAKERLRKNGVAVVTVRPGK